jgi:hypothetical protein
MTCEAARGLLDTHAGREVPEAFDDHANACPACTELLAERRALEEGVAAALLGTGLLGTGAGTGTGPSDAELAERVIAAMPTGSTLSISMSPRLAMWPRLAAAAALLVAGGLVAWQVSQPVPDGADAGSTTASAERPYSLLPPPVDDYVGPHFVDITDRSGIEKRDHTGRGGTKDWMVEVVGHGAAVLDMDGDGDLDLFVPDGNRLEPAEQVTGTWRLFRNDGDMRFTDVTAGSGLETDAWASGAIAGDLDADGRPDLFVPCFGENKLYRNLGDGRFADVSAAAGVQGLAAEWSTAATLGDVDGDGDLDLYVANYADMRQFMVEAGVGRGCRWREMPVPCGPQPMLPQRDRLYLNDGTATFEDVTISHLPIDSRYSFQPVFSDLDDDGALDLFVAADGHPNLLLLNDGSGHFSEHGRESGVATDADGREQACMGVAVGDVDDDGLMDLFVTNFSHESNVLYRGRPGSHGRPVFADVTRGAGLDQPSFFTLGWGAVLADLDCDGDLDALTANGHLYPDVAEAVESTAYEQHISLLENTGGGRFREVTASAGDGVTTPRAHRGLVAADLDDDGRVDLFSTVLNGSAVVLRNEGGATGNFVKLLLRRQDGRVEAAGARAIADVGGRRQIRDLQIGSSFGSSDDPRVLLGLGAAESADVAVRWLRTAEREAVTESFGQLSAGHTYVLVEGSGVARRVE